MNINLIIVCTGGRDYSDYNMVHDALKLFNPDKIYVGDSAGAVWLVQQYCQDNNIPCEIFYADWEKHGKAAGPIRNKEMLKSAGTHALVLAFPGGKGTQNCIKQAIAFNNIVFKVEA